MSEQADYCLFVDRVESSEGGTLNVEKTPANVTLRITYCNNSCRENHFGDSTAAVFPTGHMGIVFETDRSDVFSQWENKARR